jgi:4-hydroxybenzoate polyprenyltransferase
MNQDSLAGTSRASRPLASAWRVISASRVHKLIPLLLLMTNAGLLAGSGVSPGLYALAVVFVLVSSMLGMQLNVLTDSALDRRTKPHLLALLKDDQHSLRLIVWTEVWSCAALLVWIALSNVSLALALLAYTLGFTLYSYNFLVPGGQTRARLKVYWWGNLITVLGAYLALWIAGFALARPPAANWVLWASIACAISIVDYGVFLNECAGDAATERAHGLRTLPALLGERGASALAIGILALGVSLLAALLLRFWSQLNAVQMAALIWHAGVQAASALSTLLVVRRGRSRWEVLVDLSFWISRVGALAILVGGAWFG